MVFNSIGFLYAFLPITYVVFWNLKTKNQRYLWLTITGYVFYSFWNYRFCALMAFSTAASYFAGLGMLRWDDDPRRRRLCLILPIVTDLALLGFFKYAGMFVDMARTISARLGSPLDLPLLHIVLPIGISFYTFHTISYMVDSYRRVIKPTRNPFEFACYVSLFCQLVAGPIVRFREIEADLDNLDAIDRKAYWNRGWSFFVIGMIKKVLIADTIAAVVDPALAQPQSLSTLATWAVMLGYTFQLYFDFSGYSDMAVGLGCLFGLTIPQNFDSPYKATDPSDFWRRWHISLSTTLRDYLYIPLGGNRRSINRNLFLTMLLGGLWHGANWTFVAWGAYHGILLMAYRNWRSIWDRMNVVYRRMGMFLAVTIGWVLFRSSSFSMARDLFKKMFWWQHGEPVKGILTLTIFVALGAAVTQMAPNTFEMSHEWTPSKSLALVMGFGLSVAVTYVVGLSPFLYFQF